MEIVLEKRKNDQYREGHWVVIARRPGSIACPVKLAKRLINRLGLKGHRPLFSGGSYSRAPAPYQAVRKAMLDKFASIGLVKTKFGTQPCRAGGATLVANMGIPDRVWMDSARRPAPSHQGIFPLTAAVAGPPSGSLVGTLYFVVTPHV